MVPSRCVYPVGPLCCWAQCTVWASSTVQSLLCPAGMSCSCPEVPLLRVGVCSVCCSCLFLWLCGFCGFCCLCCLCCFVYYLCLLFGSFQSASWKFDFWSVFVEFGCINMSRQHMCLFMSCVFKAFFCHNSVLTTNHLRSRQWNSAVFFKGNPQDSTFKILYWVNYKKWKENEGKLRKNDRKQREMKGTWHGLSKPDLGTRAKIKILKAIFKTSKGICNPPRSKKSMNWTGVERNERKIKGNKWKVKGHERKLARAGI